MDLQGSLNEFSLSDIVQFLSGSAKSGLLRLSGTSSQGMVFFDDGAMVHAELSGLEGEEAFYELMRWEEGRFAFEPEVAVGKKTIRGSNTNLLMEAARRKDEWAVLSERIADTSLIPEFVLPEQTDAGKQITLNTSEWVVLSKIDGERSLKEVARASHLSEFHTCRLLFSLVTNGLIRLREPSS